MKYRATVYRDDGEDAAVEARGTDPVETLDEAVAAGRALAVTLAWPLWSGTVEAGEIVPWTPEPGVHLTEWQGDDYGTRAYFGPDWLDR
jgi:hypothetical protein